MLSVEHKRLFEAELKPLLLLPPLSPILFLSKMPLKSLDINLSNIGFSAAIANGSLVRAHFVAIILIFCFCLSISKHGLAKEMSKRENSVDGDGMSAVLLSFSDGGKSLMKEGGQESREF